MNIDFHYGMIYIVGRLAGLDADDARIVAHSCQYVDDATTPGILHFEEGQTFERFASAHVMIDYKNSDDHDTRLVWAPFHFLPGNHGTSFEERVVCRRNSEVAQAMVRQFLAAPPMDNALHRLGVMLHVYVDTFAHEGFSGIISDGNKVTNLVGHEHEPHTWLEKLEGELNKAWGAVQSDVVDMVSRLGHGAALHFPDLPWARWTYTNGFGEDVERDNLPMFLDAANMAARIVQAHRNRAADFADQPGLSETELAIVRDFLDGNREHEGEERLKIISSRLEQGAFPSLQEKVPDYIAKGAGSWKYAATGIETDDDGGTPPRWSEAFENSHYRKFHDAIKEHRYAITQEILPAFQLRLA